MVEGAHYKNLIGVKKGLFMAFISKKTLTMLCICVFSTGSYCFHASSMEVEPTSKSKVTTKKSKRVIIDKELMTQVYYDDEIGEVKILIRDPKSKIKELVFYSQSPEMVRQNLTEIFRSWEKVNVLSPNKKEQGVAMVITSMFEFHSKTSRKQEESLTFIGALNKNVASPNIVTYKNKKIKFNKMKINPIWIEFQSFGFFTKDSKEINLEDYFKNNKVVPNVNSAQINFLYNILTDKEEEAPLTVESMDKLANQLMSQGVNREILFKYVPGNLFITPEREMRAIVNKIIHEHDFKSEAKKDHLDEIKFKINNYKSKETGPTLLEKQLLKGHFPLESSILEGLSARLNEINQDEMIEKNNIINTALSLTMLFSGDFRDNAQSEDMRREDSEKDLMRFATFLKEKIDLYLETQTYNLDFLEIIKGLSEELGQLNPMIDLIISLNQIPQTYYIIQNLLEKNRNSIHSPKMRQLITDLIVLLKNQIRMLKLERDPLDHSKNLISYVDEMLVKLSSFDVHEKLANAKDKIERCSILHQYLKEVDNADRSVFSQELVDKNIGAIALGEGLTFDFSINTKELETCVNLQFYLYDQKKELDPEISTMEIERDDDCTLLFEMGSLINEISHHTKLLEEINKCKQ